MIVVKSDRNYIKITVSIIKKKDEGYNRLYNSRNYIIHGTNVSEAADIAIKEYEKVEEYDLEQLALSIHGISAYDSFIEVIKTPEDITA